MTSHRDCERSSYIALPKYSPIQVYLVVELFSIYYEQVSNLTSFNRKKQRN